MSNFNFNKPQGLFLVIQRVITKPRKTCKIEGKDRLDTSRIECHQALENAKVTYLENLGNKVDDPIT